MSSEKHLDGDTRELSEFEVLLTIQQWSQLLGRRLEPMGQAGQAFSPGPRYKPMWLASEPSAV